MAPEDSRVKSDSFSLAFGEVVGGRYRIVRVIGRGGMGEVYEAHDQLLNDRIALKTLRADLARDEDIVRRFQREIQLSRKVTHPNVCRVFETGICEVPAGSGMDDPPLPYFTMELLSGEALSQRIRRVGRLPSEEAFPIAVQMAEGLQAAHRAGIVHADFKSGNVVLVRGPHGDRAVITDFGLARVDAQLSPEEETQTMGLNGGVKGTLAYMSPEQMTGDAMTPASDIYSFGIVLFEMATGKLPFDKRHAIHAAMQRVGGDSVDARELVPNLDPRWEEGIERCLQPVPQRRFVSAAALADYFREPDWRRLRLQWTRRQWTRAIAAAAACAILAVALGMWRSRPYRPKPQAIEWYQRGVEALHSMSYEASRRAFERAVAADPGYALAHASLARAYQELDYSDLAKESMLKAVTAAQESRLSAQDLRRLRALHFVVARDYDRAAKLFAEIEAAAGEHDKAAAALETGWIAQQSEDTEGASAAYARALKLDPSYAAAKLRLGFMLGRRGKLDDAMAAFDQAESLYNASSNYEGVTETLIQRARLLNRSNRAQEALPVIEKALWLAQAVGNRYQQISLALVQATAARNMGDAPHATELSQHAIDEAIAANMDNLATSAMIELGNSYFTADDHAAAETLLRRALDLAGRARVRRIEARARLSLGSLCEYDHRPKEARQFVEASLPFYRQAGYRREYVQALVVLGSIHEDTADFDEGVRVLREALAIAVQLQDSRTEAMVREGLAENLRDQGAWPEALAEFERAAGLLGSRASGARLRSAEMYWRLGRRQESERSLADAERLLEKTPDKQHLFDLRIDQARIAYEEGHMLEAVSFSRRARAVPHAATLGGEPRVQLIEALVGIRTRAESAMGSGASAAIDAFDRAGLPLEAAVARLETAEALLSAHAPPSAMKAAEQLASDAIGFFEPRKIWEADWRAHWAAARAAQARIDIDTHRSAALSAAAQLKVLWPAGTFDGYIKRAGIWPLASGLKL